MFEAKTKRPNTSQFFPWNIVWSVLRLWISTCLACLNLFILWWRSIVPKADWRLYSAYTSESPGQAISARLVNFSAR